MKHRPGHIKKLCRPASGISFKIFALSFTQKKIYLVVFDSNQLVMTFVIMKASTLSTIYANGYDFSLKAVLKRSLSSGKGDNSSCRFIIFMSIWKNIIYRSTITKYCFFKCQHTCIQNMYTVARREWHTCRYICVQSHILISVCSAARLS